MNAAAETTRPERPEQRSGSEARRIADALIRARLDRTAVAPFTRRLPYLRVDTAYEAQSLVVQHRLEAGERIIGAKLGLTSRVKRQALGIHEPVFGRLTSGMVVPHGQALQLDELIHHYKRSATELWKFCGSSGGQWLQAAHALAYLREQGEEADWWEQGAPRRRS